MSNFFISRSLALSHRTTVLLSGVDTVLVESYWPRLTLIWTYLGTDPQGRREEIHALDYPQIDIVVPETSHSLGQMAELISPETDVCVFWADDDKPVSPMFLQELVRPLSLEGSDRAAMHLWAGNALAIPKDALVNVREPHFTPSLNSFMKLALSFLDVGAAEFGARSQVVFSSTERLAPLCGDPVGRVS